MCGKIQSAAGARGRAITTIKRSRSTMFEFVNVLRERRPALRATRLQRIPKTPQIFHMLHLILSCPLLFFAFASSLSVSALLVVSRGQCIREGSRHQLHGVLDCADDLFDG